MKTPYKRLQGSLYGFWHMTQCKHANTVQNKRANRKNVRKESVAQKTDVPGHRFYIDLSKGAVKYSENVTTIVRTGRSLCAKPRERNLVTSL